MSEQITEKIDLSFMAAAWPSGLLPRERVGEFTGGLYSPAYMANLDSKGLGPEGFMVGRKKVYTVPVYISWLEQRATTEKLDRVCVR